MSALALAGPSAADIPVGAPEGDVQGAPKDGAAAQPAKANQDDKGEFNTAVEALLRHATSPEPGATGAKAAPQSAPTAAASGARPAAGAPLGARSPAGTPPPLPLAR
jgi:hypothetical protein